MEETAFFFSARRGFGIYFSSTIYGFHRLTGGLLIGDA
jgi:hypothetical protein